MSTTGTEKEGKNREGKSCRWQKKIWQISKENIKYLKHVSRFPQKYDPVETHN
jgi:hypothetical protein